MPNFIMKSLDLWLSEYGVSHRNPVNKTLHWICVPLIVFSLLGLLRAIPVGGDVVNAATVAAVLALFYYLSLSLRLTLGIVIGFALMYWGVQACYYALGAYFVVVMAACFVIAWIGQFIGHQVEGRKPSFFKDLQFLLIGPLWLLAALYRRLHLLDSSPAGGANHA